MIDASCCIVLSTLPLVLYSAFSTPFRAISNLLYAKVYKRYRKEQRYRLPVLYDKYNTGGAFDVPMQNTIRGMYVCYAYMYAYNLTTVNILNI